MGRRHRNQDQVPEHRQQSGRDRRQRRGRQESGRDRRPRRGRRLALLLALAGGAVYLVRRNQRKAELDEGIWHEAPASATPASGAAAFATPSPSA